MGRRPLSSPLLWNCTAGGRFGGVGPDTPGLACGCPAVAWVVGEDSEVKREVRERYNRDGIFFQELKAAPGFVSSSISPKSPT